MSLNQEMRDEIRNQIMSIGTRRPRTGSEAHEIAAFMRKLDDQGQLYVAQLVMQYNRITAYLGHLMLRAVRDNRLVLRCLDFWLACYYTDISTFCHFGHDLINRVGKEKMLTYLYSKLHLYEKEVAYFWYWTAREFKSDKQDARVKLISQKSRPYWLGDLQQ